jgi:hypothetical protein
LESLKGRDLIGDLDIRLEDNGRLDLREIGWEVVDWSHMGEDSGGLL